MTERLHFRGENINRNTHIATMLDTSYLEARAYLPLKHLAYLKVGDQANLTSALLTAKIKLAPLFPAPIRARKLLNYAFNLTQKLLTIGLPDN